MSRLPLTLLLTILMMVGTQAVVIKMKKQNIFIQQNSNYTFKLDISQTRSQINPINVSMDHLIYNSMGTTNQYFDYFKYLSKEDIACYNYSIGNASYLYPCPFLLNNDTVLRAYQIEDVIGSNNQSIRGLSEFHQHFIVDNTPYPFPNGAYPYTDLWITSTTNLIVEFHDSFKETGIRLIFITVTLLVIYSVVIGILVYKTKKIQKEMLQRSPDYNLKRRPSELSRQNKEIKQEDEQSDIDNYEQIIANQNSLRASRESREIPTSKNDEFQVNSLLSSLEKEREQRIMNRIQNNKQ